MDNLSFNIQLFAAFWCGFAFCAVCVWVMLNGNEPPEDTELLYTSDERIKQHNSHMQEKRRARLEEGMYFN